MRVLAAAAANPQATGVFLLAVGALVIWAGAWYFDNEWEMPGVATIMVGLIIGVVGIKTALTGEMW